MAAEESSLELNQTSLASLFPAAARTKSHGKGVVLEQQPSSSSSSVLNWIDEVMDKDVDKKGITYFRLVSNDEAASSQLHSYPSMFTAPINMRLVNRDDTIFNPALISIGPFHRNKFPSMDEPKIRFMFSMLLRNEKMLQRLKKSQQWREKYIKEHKTRGKLSNALRDPLQSTFVKPQLENLDEVMQELEQKARGYYSKAFPEMNQSQFVKMMILDGCFLLEVFRMHSGHCTADGDDPIFSTRWMLPLLALDFLKLENQLPFFVLEELYRLTRSPDEPDLMSLADKFLALLCPESAQLTGVESPEHLLALFHSKFIDHFTVDMEEQAEQHRNGGERFSIPSVKDLLLSGIKVINKKPSLGSNFLDIEYDEGKLEIPTLVIDHSTNTLMRNLVAYEQCIRTVPPIFTSYLTFMDALVNSPEDVEVLRIAGIIDHYMNSNEEVSKLINNLTANINYDMTRGYLKELNKQIYQHYHSPLSKLKVRIKRLVYSRETVICIVTIFALYLTLLQTGVAVVPFVTSLLPARK